MRIKRNFFPLSLVALTMAVTSVANVSAANVETSFTYSGLYKSIKTASANEYSQISLNFYLLEKGLEKERACPIEDGYISDGENRSELTINERGQMLLPLDKSMKRDRAAITIMTARKDMCHLNMRVEVASFELENTSIASVNAWIGQMNGLFAELAGWPGRYFMPELTGLNFKLTTNKVQSVHYVNGGERELIATADADNLFVSLEQLARLPKQGRLVFSAQLLSVTPQLSK